MLDEVDQNIVKIISLQDVLIAITKSNSIYILLKVQLFFIRLFCRFQGEGELKFPGGVHYIGKFEKGKAVEVSIWMGSFHIKVNEPY